MAPAELFVATHRSKRGSLRYHRFDTSAEAIKFAIESLTAEELHGAVMEVAEARFDRDEIARLYGNLNFPLAALRRVATSAAIATSR